jgi:hypothetical protein
VDQADLSVPVDDQQSRQAVNAEAPFGSVPTDRQRDREVLFRKIVPCLLGRSGKILIAFGVNRQKDDIGIRAVSRVKRIELGEFLAARGAPGCPECQHGDASAQGFVGDRAAGGRAEGKAGAAYCTRRVEKLSSIAGTSSCATSTAATAPAAAVARPARRRPELQNLRACAPIIAASNDDARKITKCGLPVNATSVKAMAQTGTLEPRFTTRPLIQGLDGTAPPRRNPASKNKALTRRTSVPRF